VLVSVDQTTRQRINYFYVNEQFQCVSTERIVYCSHFTLFYQLMDWGPPKCSGPLAVAQSAPPLNLPIFLNRNFKPCRIFRGFEQLFTFIG